MCGKKQTEHKQKSEQKIDQQLFLVLGTVSKNVRHGALLSEVVLGAINAFYSHFLRIPIQHKFIKYEGVLSSVSSPLPPFIYTLMGSTS